ncbi:MAG: PQQ-binding-like beta-propeller repeat protein [Pirellulaceae bacterium]|nr:PQQ-binding-like beta-propeller repeat protein [Pirellulaceae bacterium]
MMKRPIRKFASTVVIAVACWQTLSASNHALASDWPVSRGNPASTGATADQLPSEPELIWQLPLGGNGFEGAPVIEKQTIYLGDFDGRVVAVDLISGKLKWEKKFDTNFAAPAAVQGDLLLIGDLDGKLHAIKSNDGSELWAFETEAQIDAGASFFGDTVLITSEDGTLYCLNKTNGQLIWKYETGDQLRCGATLSGERTFLGGCDGKLHIVDVKLGKSAREPAPLDGPTGSTPAVAGGLAIVPTHGGDLFALKVEDGSQAWKFRDQKLAQEFQNSVAISEQLVVASSQNRRVFALDLTTGVKRWDITLRKKCDSSPVIAGDKIALAASDGRIMLLDLASGRELWLYEVKGSFTASPAVADNKLVVASDKGTIFCFGSK